MDWLLAVAQQAAKPTNPWLAAVAGGLGALLGGCLTSTIAWRGLVDTKKARQRNEEKEAIGIITAALLQVRQAYRNNDMDSDPPPEGFDRWEDYLHAALGEAEVAVMVFRTNSVRERLQASINLLVWANDSQLLYESRLHSARAVAHIAHKDFLDCLGAIRRDQPLPQASQEWTTANDALRWQFELERRAAAGE